jgi:hypothetical protein
MMTGCESSRRIICGLRRTKRRAFIGKYPRRIGPNRKPTATVFGISPIFLETNGSLWAKVDIDTARGVVIVDRGKDLVLVSHMLSVLITGQVGA